MKISKDGKKAKKQEDWVKKRSVFFKLPYWEKNKLRHNLDVMHIEKNVSENLIATLLNMYPKTKDGLDACQDLVELGSRQELHPVEDDEGNQTIPNAPFTMSREKRRFFVQ